MINEEPNIKDNSRYSISETAEILGVHRRTILRHTEAGYIKCGYYRTNQRKFYFGKEIKRYWKAQY